MPLPAAELVSAADRLLAQDRRQLLTVVVARDRREVLQAAATAASTEQRKANERNSNRNLNKREARQQPGFSLASAPNGAGTRRVHCDINVCKSRDTSGSFLRLVRPTFLC
jgi:uncharacterized protein YcgI (DUF1989 family)